MHGMKMDTMTKIYDFIHRNPYDKTGHCWLEMCMQMDNVVSDGIRSSINYRLNHKVLSIVNNVRNLIKSEACTE